MCRFTVVFHKPLETIVQSRVRVLICLWRCQCDELALSQLASWLPFCRCSLIAANTLLTQATIDEQRQGTHTHTHTCTGILMKTFIDIIHSPAPYPKPNRHTWMRNPSWTLTLNPNHQAALCRSVVKSGLARMSSLSKMSSLGSKKHPVLTMQEVKAHTHFPSLYIAVSDVQCLLVSHTSPHTHRHSHTP